MLKAGVVQRRPENYDTAADEEWISPDTRALYTAGPVCQACQQQEAYNTSGRWKYVTGLFTCLQVYLLLPSNSDGHLFLKQKCFISRACLKCLKKTTEQSFEMLIFFIFRVEMRSNIIFNRKCLDCLELPVSTKKSFIIFPQMWKSWNCWRYLAKADSVLNKTIII